jgi:hypothetical protein
LNNIKEIKYEKEHIEIYMVIKKMEENPKKVNKR